MSIVNWQNCLAASCILIILILTSIYTFNQPKPKYEIEFEIANKLVFDELPTKLSVSTLNESADILLLSSEHYTSVVRSCRDLKKRDQMCAVAKANLQAIAQLYYSLTRCKEKRNETSVETTLSTLRNAITNQKEFGTLLSSELLFSVSSLNNFCESPLTFCQVICGKPELEIECDESCSNLVIDSG
jgi:hypothetical protein